MIWRVSDIFVRIRERPRPWTRCWVNEDMSGFASQGVGGLHVAHSVGSGCLTPTGHNRLAVARVYATVQSRPRTSGFTLTQVTVRRVDRETNRDSARRSGSVGLYHQLLHGFDGGVIEKRHPDREDLNVGDLPV